MSVCSCLHCGKEAGSQCKKCKRAYYCSEECKTADWKQSHEFECESSGNVDASVENRWTGLFRDQTKAYMDWITVAAEDCDPGSEDALELRAELEDKLDKLKDQADLRFSESVVDRYAENLKNYATSSILHDAEAASYKRQLLGGSISELVRVFGVGQQGSLTKQDYESALTAHISSLVDFTETLKDSNANEETIEGYTNAALTTAVRAGQVFWGRSWRPEYN